MLQQSVFNEPGSQDCEVVGALSIKRKEVGTVLFLAFAFWWAGRVGELSSVISSWRQGLETIFWDGKVLSSVIFVLLYWERYLNIVDVGVVTGTVVVFVLSGWNCMKLGKFGFLEEQFAWDVAVLSTDWMFKFLGCEF